MDNKTYPIEYTYEQLKGKDLVAHKDGYMDEDKSLFCKEGNTYKLTSLNHTYLFFIDEEGDTHRWDVCDIGEYFYPVKVVLYNPVKNISHSKYERCPKNHNSSDVYLSRKSGCVWMWKSFCNKYYYWADYNAKNEVIYFRGEVDWVKSNYKAYEDENTTTHGDGVLATFSVAEDAFDTGDLGREEEYVEVVECPEADKLITPKKDDFIDFSDHNEFIKDVPAVKRLPVKSDGGKSSYYEVVCPQWFIDKVNSGSFMVEDLAEIMYGNDFNYTNILKAQKRMYEMENGGGKEGNTLEYDATKCKYYIDKQLEIAKRGV